MGVTGCRRYILTSGGPVVPMMAYGRDYHPDPARGRSTKAKGRLGFLLSGLWTDSTQRTSTGNIAQSRLAFTGEDIRANASLRRLWTRPWTKLWAGLQPPLPRGPRRPLTRPTGLRRALRHEVRREREFGQPRTPTPRTGGPVAGTIDQVRSQPTQRNRTGLSGRLHSRARRGHAGACSASPKTKPP